MHGHSDVNVDDWFQKADISARATRVTRGALNVRPRYGRLEVRKHSFTVRVTTNWNSVPRELKQKTSANSFKMAYVEHRAQNNYV